MDFEHRGEGPRGEGRAGATPSAVQHVPVHLLKAGLGMCPGVPRKQVCFQTCVGTSPSTGLRLPPVWEQHHASSHGPSVQPEPHRPAPTPHPGLPSPQAPQPCLSLPGSLWHQPLPVWPSALPCPPHPLPLLLPCLVLPLSPLETLSWSPCRRGSDRILPLTPPWAPPSHWFGGRSRLP